MSYSIQTNVDSIRAQENLRVNGNFQSRTINRLTSGYRINSSGDDAAGLAVANKFRGDITELNQGVRNANDGISTLEIVDGGLNNISQMLDRLRTLATQSSSASFSGSRVTLNTEYQTLLTEINRQASNIGLSNGAIAGRFSKAIDVYIGGGSGVQSNATATVDLSGARVDATGLGIQATNIMAGGATTISTSANLATSANLLNSAGATQVFHFQLSSSTTPVDVTINGNANGLSGSQVIDQFNQALNKYGIVAGMDSNGKLAFYGEQTAFSIDIDAASAGTSIATATAAAGANDISNANMYVLKGVDAPTILFGTGQKLDVTIGGTVYTYTTTSAAVNTEIAGLNSLLNAKGVYAIKTSGGGIELQGAVSFSASAAGVDTAHMISAAGAGQATTAGANAGTNYSATSNALSAITALTSAVTNLGNVQGKVGTGQNQLQYAVSLAQSQITSFSAAESRIRDTDVAAEAANLTKAQVLQQASIAAMTQANSAPQAVMALLRG